MIYYLAKRVLDFVGSIIGLILLSPFLFIIAVAIKLNSPGPIFADTPQRVGKNGKLFKMYKFRSMFIGAHDILHNNPKYKNLLEKYKKNSYKLAIDEDPRITKVGKFLRRTSIDELPQLINIFKSEMSLVGPRAYYPFELEEQQIKHPQSRKYVKIILTGKPGLTGLWQVTGRSGINFDKRVKIDAEYVTRRSIFLDFWIIIKTIPAVLSGKGAV